MERYTVLLFVLYSFFDICRCDCYYYSYYYGYEYCDDYLSAGAIIGIIFGAIVGLVLFVSLIALVVICCCNKTHGATGTVIAPQNTHVLTPAVAYVANPSPPVVSSYTSTYYPAAPMRITTPSVAINFNTVRQYPSAPPPPYQYQ